MADEFVISNMTEQELNDIAIVWARDEGWNPGLHDALSFYTQDPTGFFVGRLNGEPIGCCAATVYDHKFAFFGFYIVKAEYRHLGYGMQMTQHRLAYVGDRNIGLDGVVDMCEKYKNIGFKIAHQNIRHSGHCRDHIRIHPNIVTIDETLEPTIIEYDRVYFPASRLRFLDHWLYPKQGAALAYVEENCVKGYGVIRQCFSGFKIGPLFAEDPIVAESLFQALVNHANHEAFYLDIPEPNLFAQRLVERFNMEPCFNTLRMYTKKTPNINLNHVYGITTFELG